MTPTPSSDRKIASIVTGGNKNSIKDAILFYIRKKTKKKIQEDIQYELGKSYLLRIK